MSGNISSSQSIHAMSTPAEGRLRRGDGPLAAYALVDCNNFYCSCERLFQPKLAKKPIVVLSNNDGCIISRSEEAKVLGVPMGSPWHLLDPVLRKQIEVFSSNYGLYGDLSARVMETLATCTTDMEIYSIDEAFLRLDGFRSRGLTAYASQLRSRVRQWTGITVSIGIGPTKTLAKIASRMGKKDPRHNGVLNLNACWEVEGLMDRLLENVPVGDIWGIGRRNAAKLHARGVVNARQLRDKPDAWLQKLLTKTGLHTALELRGIPCMPLASVPPPRRTILSSRSFGELISNQADIRQAVVWHMTRAGEKLRREKLSAITISVFIKTNKHLQERQYHPYATRTLPFHTDYTPTLVKAALEVLDSIYKDGYRYQKVGVVLSGLEGAGTAQHSLLPLAQGNTASQAGEQKLMEVADSLNEKYGRGTLQIAEEGFGKRTWTMKQDHLSPRYTAAWDELPDVGLKEKEQWEKKKNGS